MHRDAAACTWGQISKASARVAQGSAGVLQQVCADRVGSSTRVEQGRERAACVPRQSQHRGSMGSTESMQEVRAAKPAAQQHRGSTWVMQ